MRYALALLLLALPSLAWGATRETLPTGLRVIVQPDPATEVVAADVLLRISAADEPAGQAGVRYLTHHLLLRGASHDSGEALGDRLAEVGGSIALTVGLDYVEVHIVAPAEGFEAALGVLAEVVRVPAFLPEEFARERQNALDALRAEQEDSFQSAYQALREAIYGEGPYARSTTGEGGALQRLTRDDVVTFYQQHYVPANAILSIAGGVDGGRAVRAARQAFGGWQAEGRRPAKAGGAAPLAHSDIAVREVPGRQAYLMLGFPAPAVSDPQYYVVQVIDSLLSGGSGARLPYALRAEAGLAYQIASFYPTLAGGSHFGIYVAVDPGRIVRVKGVVLRELSRLREEPAKPEELARAKRYLLGCYLMGRQEVQARAYSSAWYDLLDLGPDFETRYRQSVSNVTAEQVQEVAQELIQHFVLALALPRQ